MERPITVVGATIASTDHEELRMSHDLSPITFRKATTPGALDHYGCECSCGHKVTNTFEISVANDASAHVEFMKAKEAK